MKEELKACPFCGSDKVEIYQHCKTGMTIKCKNCLIKKVQRVKTYTLEWLEDIMIKAWNTRTPDINTEMLEALKWCIDIFDNEPIYSDSIKTINTIIQKAQEVEGE